MTSAGIDVSTSAGHRVLYRCGCVNGRHAPSGVLRSVSKCSSHLAKRNDPAVLGKEYYEGLGVLSGGKLAKTAHLAELSEALGEFEAPGCPYALEIGCGASPYYRAICAAGYHYTGVDTSNWASLWMLGQFGAGVMVCRFEEADIDATFGLILAAHSLEHMEDAPGALVRMADLLAPGGSLWVVVPDDSDPVNQDHLWFFTEATLRSCIEAAGLVVEKTAVRRIVKHENFVYARARKP